MFELYLLTFNCARNLVEPASLAPVLFDALPAEAQSHVPDIFAISLQEIAPIAYSFLGGSYLTPYFDRIATTVQLATKHHAHGDDQVQHVATRSLGMTALMIFAKPQLAERIQWIQSAGVGVGFWNMGNKGAVAMRIGLSARRPNETVEITFTAAHLAPMECNVEARNKDWENIVRNLVFLNHDSSGYSSSEESPLLAPSEFPADNNGLFHPKNSIFVAGDLNYRTHDNPPGLKSHQRYPQPTQSVASPDHFSHLLQKDQLIREREANRTLHGFQELAIKFPPTYKYSMHRREQSISHKRSASAFEAEWVWAKHRYPSWCDRILFFPPASSQFKPHVYTSLSLQPTSDHQPVALSVSVDDQALNGESMDDLRYKSPFPINPNWKVRRDSARRLEIIVGVLSYFALTKKGNAIVVTFLGLAFALWWAGRYWAT